MQHSRTARACVARVWEAACLFYAFHGSRSEGAGLDSFVEYRVLGPLDVAVDGASVALGGYKQRLLLASLLVSANEVVSSDRLVEVLWGDKASDVSATTLRKCVHRLRTVLDRDRSISSDTA